MDAYGLTDSVFFRERAQQLQRGLRAARVSPMGRNVGQWTQYKRPLMHPRVGDNEVGTLQLLPVVVDDIDINHTGPIPNRRCTPQIMFDLLDESEQRFWRKLGYTAQHHI
jgi:hypothetical protein